VAPAPGTIGRGQDRGNYSDTGSGSGPRWCPSTAGLENDGTSANVDEDTIGRQAGRRFHQVFSLTV
jgi:hypothetical protein